MRVRAGALWILGNIGLEMEASARATPLSHLVKVLVQSGEQVTVLKKVNVIRQRDLIFGSMPTINNLECLQGSAQLGEEQTFRSRIEMGISRHCTFKCPHLVSVSPSSFPGVALTLPLLELPVLSAGYRTQPPPSV